ncbi:MAG: hypothetical protein KGH61_01670 [Candidatus Micrarchaeota archaeon]|nr:hypothetical protein [Candidatus Micrarchaeota archaeon]MDE1847638.1 hypothetical protein [Candidatus Micrarchaeota archaeon]MDE1864459.1 hypothetical protein [Candidatus Micrarchaeota archaeon]
MTKPMPEIRKKVLDEVFADWEDYKHHFNSVSLKVATLEKLINKTIKATVEKLERGE